MNAMKMLAQELSRESDELSDYARQIDGAVGEIVDTERMWFKASILAEVAKAATKAAEAIEAAERQAS